VQQAARGTERDGDLARVAVLLSGSGRTLRNLLECSEPRGLPVRIARVISTRANVAGNSVATEAGIPLSVVPRREFESTEEFSQSILRVLDAEQPDLVVCAGFLSKLLVPDRYMGRIINIHPSLLPLFGGKGLYGDRVHRAVLDSGMKVTGCTVHFVDNAYDAGPIIAQRCVSVLPDDTVEAVAGRVFEEECRLYPAVIRDIVQGRTWLEGRAVQFRADAGRDSHVD
jgi:phosphoribosylglycinamide formyltransferase 1